MRCWRAIKKVRSKKIKSKAVVVNQRGRPEVLSYQDYNTGQPGPGEVLVRNTAIGVNYIDTHYRSGLYPAALPLIPGDQAAAVVEAVGPEVSGFKPGDRVAYASKPLGAYSKENGVPFALEDTAEAHRHLEDRSIVGFPILIP